MTFDTSLPTNVYSAEQVREIDRRAIEEYGIDGFELMQKAARFSFHVLTRRWPDTRSITVMCGAGNNAGDGYIIAGIAQKHGLLVDVIYLSEPSNLTGDAQSAYRFCQEQGVKCTAFDANRTLQETGVIVDALLGTGINKAVTGHYLEAIQWSNQSPCPVLAIDIPTGLSADTGQAMGCAIDANATATFIGIKLGQFTGKGAFHCGQVYYDQLDVPDEIIERVPASAKRLNLDKILAKLPDRPADAHKGQNGHVLLIGGDYGFGGAITMAAEASARVGAGLVTVATHAEHCAPVLTRCPEVMCKAVHSSSDLKHLLQRASVIVLGPGLGQSAWSQHMLFTALQTTVPTVLDADALNLICKHPEWLPEDRTHLVYTPHPGEAARMLNCTTEEIQANRLNALASLNKQYGGNILLKGSGSLIKAPETLPRLCTYGNPGMASGGMGDVLSGLLGGLLAQMSNQEQAIDLAIALHGQAADQLAQQYGERGLLASDLIPQCRALLNQKETVAKP